MNKRYRTKEVDSQSRLIVITGVTRGLGRAMVERFAELGHRIVGCGRSRPRIEQLKLLLDDSHDFQVVDVAKNDEVHSWAKRILDLHGIPDLVLNNAALINRRAPLWEISANEFSEVIDVNIKGIAYVIQAFVPAMVAQKKGVIVNFSSGWGHSTAPEVAPYCATKWAIEGLTQALAQELPRGMATVALSPGIINTEMLQSFFGSQATSYQSPKEWAAKAVPFLLKIDAQDNGKSVRIPDEQV